MLRLLTLLLSCVAVCAQPVLSLNDPTVVAKSSSLLQGLVGYWQLEESSGTRYDRSPNGNHLTANNSPTNETGKVNACAKLTSSSSQSLSRLSPSGLPSGSNDFTCAAWVKMNSFQGVAGSRIVVAIYDYGANKRSWSITTEKPSSVYFQAVFSSDGSNPSAIQANNFGALATNVWYFVCSRKNGTNTSISVNAGTANTGTISSIYPSTTPLTIGSRLNNGTPIDFFDGLIDEIGIWNRCLSDNEVSIIYKSSNGVTYPRFSMRDNRADDFNWDTWEPLYDKPKPFPTLYAFVNRREPEPLLTICE